MLFEVVTDPDDLRAHIARDQIERLVIGEQHAVLRQKLSDYLLAAGEPLSLSI